ncbi:hypothetical protein GOODEAATRI_014362 [Goodea atripinnis]|uniref:Uncharacterized protein n=1 Tax=Goodea atripinnis TaxID=208336 RepID=A0ABV0NK79_9TELE
MSNLACYCDSIVTRLWAWHVRAAHRCCRCLSPPESKVTDVFLLTVTCKKGTRFVAPFEEQTGGLNLRVYNGVIHGAKMTLMSWFLQLLDAACFNTTDSKN